MGTPRITDELVAEVAAELRDRYGFDSDDLRALGAALAGRDTDRRASENRAFAARFVAQHPDTFDRLSR